MGHKNCFMFQTEGH